MNAFGNFSNAWNIALLVVTLISWLAIPHLLLQRKRPVSTLAWLWGILLFPGLGALFYVVLGTDRIRRKRIRRRAAFRVLREFVEDTPNTVLPAAPRASAQIIEKIHALPVEDQHLLSSLSRIQQVAPTLAGEVEILPSAKLFYAQLLSAIASARHHIHLELYLWRNDEVGRAIRDALIQAARRGVQVRVLLDQMGGWSTPTRFFRPLVEAGGQFSWFQTLHPRRMRFWLNLRNHRKLQIIDGHLAFVGGMNIGQEYLGQDPALGAWEDVQIALSGPVTRQLQDVFAEDWYFATEQKITGAAYYPPAAEFNGPPAQIIAGGPDDMNNPLPGSLGLLFAAARRRLWLTAGYFVPSETILASLQMAACRGVDVRILVTEKSDHPWMVKAGRSFYDELLAYGIRIFESVDTVTHAKIALADDAWAMIGSANLDYRSMRLNFELSVLLRSEQSNAALAKIFTQRAHAAREIERAAFARRSRWQKLQEGIFRLLGPQL